MSKQKKTIADFREEWVILRRRIAVVRQNYEAVVAVDCGDGGKWLVRADLGLDLEPKPRVVAIAPEDWRPSSLTGPDGKPMGAEPPAAVMDVVRRLNDGIVDFNDGKATFPDGDAVVAAVPATTASEEGGQDAA